MELSKQKGLTAKQILELSKFRPELLKVGLMDDIDLYIEILEMVILK